MMYFQWQSLAKYRRKLLSAIAKNPRQPSDLQFRKLFKSESPLPILPSRMKKVLQDIYRDPKELIYGKTLLKRYVRNYGAWLTTAVNMYEFKRLSSFPDYFFRSYHPSLREFIGAFFKTKSLKVMQMLLFATFIIVLKASTSEYEEEMLEGVASITILTPDRSPTYTLMFTYEDENVPPKTVAYYGNLNDFLAYLEAKFPENKPPIIIQERKYTLEAAMGDSFLFLLTFLGVTLSYYILKSSNPDAVLNKLTNKQANSFKVASTKAIKVRFNDVAGMEEAKREITEFVEFLKNSSKFVQIGAKIPKGALLTGPPGTGKTMLAKACAGEAGVAFFYVSGSEFVEMFVGLGASKVRDLFKQARSQAPSIIFIDQIDAIGKKREGSHNEEKDATLNQILVQMDGFSSTETVIVMAATNRADVLDDALKRPGRFDRIVEVNLPELQARVKIFMVHLKPLTINPDLPLEAVAQRMAELTPGYSGADIANLCNQAAIIATRQKRPFIEIKDFEDASERIIAGYVKKNLSNIEVKTRVAYHQAGHAVCGWFLKGGDPLVKLTIIPRSKGALGYAQYLPDVSYLKTRSDLIDRIAIGLGGITSETLIYGQFSSGGSDDLQKVYQTARMMVASFGMGSETYNVTVDDESYLRKESQFLQKKIDDQMNSLIEEARLRAKNILSEKKTIVEELAKRLLEKETINSADIVSIMGQRPSFN